MTWVNMMILAFAVATVVRWVTENFILPRD